MVLLNRGEAVCHPFVIGELACGNLKNRTNVLSLLETLPMAFRQDMRRCLLSSKPTISWGKDWAI